MMKNLCFILLCASVTAGCCAQKQCPYRDVKEAEYEKVRIVTRMETVTVYPEFRLPELRELHRNIKDSLDIIENDYARSVVTRNSDGSIDHYQELRPVILHDTVTVQIPQTDSTLIKKDSRVEKEQIVIEKTTNILHWWQKALMWMGVISIVCALIFIVRKLFPSQISTIIKFIKQLLKII